MVEDIIAHTDLGTENSVTIPLIYFLEKSNEQILQLEGMPFFKKNFNFHLLSTQTLIGIRFSNSDEILTTAIKRDGIIGYEKFPEQNFDALKTSYSAGLLKRSHATSGAGGLIPTLLVKGASALLSGNKVQSEIHIGPIYQLNFKVENKMEYVRVACEKSYEQKFELFLDNHWISKIDINTIPNNKSAEGCFVATACFGNYDCPEVRVLRAFRDQCLLRYKLGIVFVNLYYRLSPSFADFIAKQNLFKQVIKTFLLKPISIFLSKLYRL